MKIDILTTKTMYLGFFGTYYDTQKSTTSNIMNYDDDDDRNYQDMQ